MIIEYLVLPRHVTIVGGVGHNRCLLLQFKSTVLGRDQVAVEAEELLAKSDEV